MLRSRLNRIDETLAAAAMQHSMSEPRSGSDRVKGAPDSTKVHQPCLSNLYSARVFIALVKTIDECPSEIDPVATAPGSVRLDHEQGLLDRAQVCRSSSKARALRWRPESLARFIGL